MPRAIFFFKQKTAYDIATVGMNAKITAANIHFLTGLLRDDVAVTVTVGDVDPVVEPPHETIDPVLLVPLDEAGVKDFAAVGLAVAISVFGIENVGGGRDENSLSPGKDASGEADFEKNRGFVVVAVAVDVFEKANLSGWFTRSRSQRVVPHLDDPQFSVGPEGERNWVENERFGGHQLDFETGADTNGLQGRRGGFRLRRQV